MNTNPPIRIVVEAYHGSVHPAHAAVSFSKYHEPAVLESSRPETPYARFSIYTCEPAETVEVDNSGDACPFRTVAQQVSKYQMADWPHELPFGCGWIGFFAYEAGLALQEVALRPRSTAQEPDFPLARFNLYDSAAIYDHADNRWWLTAVDWPTQTARSRPCVRDRLDMVARILSDAKNVDSCPDVQWPLETALPNLSHEDYVARVQRCRQYIRAGDIYQVNMTQRFSVPTAASPASLYLRLRQTTPSSHAAYLQWGDTSILCTSPELFLDLHRGKVITRPIKGTRPRGDSAQQDLILRMQLQRSDKERAELTMITDLLRNDLGRVCSCGSIDVRCPGEIEALPHVYHRTATIEGCLANHRSWLDLLLATFPGGSITGAPKIRAMQIIDELEPTPRGVYCGSIGWIGLDGSMRMNIAIRTVLLQRGVAWVYTGSGIVADSDAESEYLETLAKAEGMFQALNCRLAPLQASPTTTGEVTVA